ncbi:MAG: DUF898 family protein [Bryobacteraceae bacterium]|nr:DUF898 family protein [Bryobacteraceae bacterium]
MSAVTLGIYYFWGKVKVRKYIYSHLEFEGDRFAFHGFGRELFVGWLKSLPALTFVVFFPYVLPVFWQSIHAVWVAQLGATAVLLLLWPLAMAGAYRYRINRMSWRGIRFSFRKSTLGFLGLSLKSYLLLIVTGGFYMPFLRTRVRRYLIDGTYFGNQQFAYDGRGLDLLPIHIFALPLSYLTLGLALPWWTAMQQRYEWAHTFFGGARFRCTVTGWGLFKLYAGNLLLLVLTLGLAMPWILTRTVSYWTGHLALTGPLELEAIEQDAQTAPTVGESFADFLGFDFGI